MYNAPRRFIVDASGRVKMQKILKKELQQSLTMLE
jgi:hypothetical protein